MRKPGQRESHWTGSMVEAYLESTQELKIELFAKAKIANGFKPLIIFAKGSVIDI